MDTLNPGTAKLNLTMTLYQFQPFGEIETSGSSKKKDL